MAARPRQRRGLTRIQGTRTGRELHHWRLARDGHGCRLRGGSAGSRTSEFIFRRIGERTGRPSTAERDGALHPPEAVQLVAFAAFHVKVELPPLPTVVGEAVKVTAALGVVTLMFTD